MSGKMIPTPVQLWQSNAGEPDLLAEQARLEAEQQAQQSAAPARSGGRTFTEEEVERIREQEKSKLYGRLNSFEQQLASIQAEREAAAQQAATLAQEAAEAQRLREEAEMDAKQLVQRTREEFETRLAEVQQEAEQTRLILEMERKFAALNAYANKRIGEEMEQQTIMPELLDLIAGDTEEQIEESIAFAKAKTAAIVASVQATLQQNPQQTAPLLAGPRGTNITAPPVGPMETQTAQQTFSVEDLRNMSMDEYSKNRHRLLSPQAQRGQGLFGNGR
jgi:hypothetical protein